MQTPLEVTEKLLREKGMNKIEFHGTDHAWGFRENEPIIALIAKKDGDIAFQTAMSLYWASAEYIPKPWCLFIGVNNIAPLQRKTIENLSKKYNIQIVNEENLIELVKEQLEKIVQILEVYIPKESDKPVKALGESVRKWREKKPVNEYSFRVEIKAGNLEIYKENGRIVPSRKTIPVTASTIHTRIDGVLPRLLSIEDGLYFDTEHRNLPMVFKLNIGSASKLVLRFEADKSNIIEATSFWSLYRDFVRNKRLAFIELNTGDIMFSCVRELNDRGNK